MVKEIRLSLEPGDLHSLIVVCGQCKHELQIRLTEVQDSTGNDRLDSLPEDCSCCGVRWRQSGEKPAALELRDALRRFLGKNPPAEYTIRLVSTIESIPH